MRSAGLAEKILLLKWCVAQDVVVGRPRDGDDRVAWLLDHKRFDKALAVLDTNRGLKASTHEQARFKASGVQSFGGLLVVHKRAARKQLLTS